MASNITVKVTADVLPLQAQMAVAKAEAAGFSKELNSLAKEAIAAGGHLDNDLKAKLVTAGEEVARAKAKVGELTAQLHTGGEGFNRFGGAITQAQELLGSFGLALSVAGFAQFLKSVLESAADLQRQADALSINVERLQALQFASRQAGVDVDESTQALKRFTANLGELQISGEGDLAKGLATLGITADELGNEPTTALLIFARAFDKVKDSAIQAAVERDAFGRSGVDLTAYLHELAKSSGDVSDALDHVRDSARDAGQVIDEKTTKAAHAFDVQLNGLIATAKASVAGFFQVQIEGWEGIAGAIGDALRQQGQWEGSSGRARIPPGAIPVPAPTFLKPQFPDPTEPKIDIAKAGGGGSGRDLAEEARRLADEIAKIWQQAALAHVQSEQATNSHLLAIGRETVDQFQAQAEALENKRYGIELQGIQRREGIDAKNKGALQKDKAEEATLALAHEDRLTHIHEDGVAKRITDQKKETDEFIKGKQEALQYDTKNIEDLYELHFVTDQQRHDLERQLTLAVQQEVLKRKDAEIAGLKEGTEAYKAAVRERTALERKFSTDVRAIDTQLTKTQEAQFEQGFHVISGAFNSAITGMIFHGESFQQAMLQMASAVGEGFVNMGLDIAEKWIESQLEMLLFEKPADLAKITDAAAVAAANAYAAFAWNPPLAAAMAAQAFATTESFAGLLSAEGGLERVAYDGQMIRAHEGEAVLPRRIAEPLMSVVQTLHTGGGSSGGLGGNVTVNVNQRVQAWDGNHAMHALRRNDSRREMERMFKDVARKHKIRIAA